MHSHGARIRGLRGHCSTSHCHIRPKPSDLRNLHLGATPVMRSILMCKTAWPNSSRSRVNAFAIPRLIELAGNNARNMCSVAEWVRQGDIGRSASGEIPMLDTIGQLKITMPVEMRMLPIDARIHYCPNNALAFRAKSSACIFSFDRAHR